MAESGYSCLLTVGGYTGDSLTEIRLRLTMDTHDATGLGSDYKQRMRGLKAWELTGRKNYTGDPVFVSQLDGQTVSLTVSITNAAGTVVFSGAGWITEGDLTLPEGVGTENVTVQGVGAPTSV